MNKFFIIFLGLIVAISPVFASDHIDTPANDSIKAADITDFYAFQDYLLIKKLLF